MIAALKGKQLTHHQLFTRMKQIDKIKYQNLTIISVVKFYWDYKAGVKEKINKYNKQNTFAMDQ